MMDILYSTIPIWKALVIIIVGGYFIYLVNILRKVAIKIYENAKEANDKDMPVYVKMTNNPKERGTEMRLRYTDASLFGPQKLEYWRDAGLWGIGYRWEQRGIFNRVLITNADFGDKDLNERLDGVLLTPISEDEYLKGNEGYVPSNYKDELNPVDIDDYKDNDDKLAF